MENINVRNHEHSEWVNMSAVENFRKALDELQVDKDIKAQLLQGYENISDKAPKARRAAFFCQVIERMDETLPPEICHAVRDACACSKGGWRLAASKKVARDYARKSLEEKLRALGQVKYMGNPVLQEDGSILASIGEKGGFECPCPVFQGIAQSEPVSLTYCYCCAGHFRFHYQIALELKLKTRAVLSSALNSCKTDPCRFVYEVE